MTVLYFLSLTMSLDLDDRVAALESALAALTAAPAASVATDPVPSVQDVTGLMVRVSKVEADVLALQTEVFPPVAPVVVA